MCRPTETDGRTPDHCTVLSAGNDQCNNNQDDIENVTFHYFDLSNITEGCATGRALDCRSTGRGFKSYSGPSCVTTLGKLFTPMCLCHQAA